MSSNSPASISIEQILSPYQARIENAITAYIPRMGDATPVRDACAYALQSNGKRFRPAIVLMVAEALEQEKEVILAALAVELFHTASLVADDLPCMDDDDERRSQPSLHRAYNEAMALLVSYALIAAGYGCIAENGRRIENDTASRLALENASWNTGLFGATGGQYLDLFPPDLTSDTLKKTIHRKTVSLFEIAFVFGWLFGGGALEGLSPVKRAAEHFGMAFQIIDDLEDAEQDQTNGRQVSYAAIFGKQKALDFFHVELKGYFDTIRELRIDSPNLMALGDFLLERSRAIS